MNPFISKLSNYKDISSVQRSVCKVEREQNVSTTIEDHSCRVKFFKFSRHLFRQIMRESQLAHKYHFSAK